MPGLEKVALRGEVWTERKPGLGFTGIAGVNASSRCCCGFGHLGVGRAGRGLNKVAGDTILLDSYAVTAVLGLDDRGVPSLDLLEEGVALVAMEVEGLFIDSTKLIGLTGGGRAFFLRTSAAIVAAGDRVAYESTNLELESIGGEDCLRKSLEAVDGITL